MKALREYRIIKDGKIIIDIPEDFGAQEVEVIVLPKPTEKKKNLGNFLLEGPVVSDEELNNLILVKEWLQKWMIEGSS